MKLNIPEQTAPASNATPSSPRKFKKVLSSLPNANMGELTKQTFQILRDQNRQIMSNEHRLENLEMLRQQTRNIFVNLKKYFINRSLPLPEKSQKIVNLNQSILQELVYGYEIIVQETAHNLDSQTDDKMLSTAICRAIKYLSEMFLRSSEVYAHCPKNLWRDIHQLYIFAETKNLKDSIVVDTENTPKEITIEICYKQILLFALARPIALRQSDSERIYKELFGWSTYAELGHRASEDQIDKIFSMRINEDSVPDYLSKDDLSNDSTIRVLDASKLVTHVKSLVAEQSNQKQKIALGDAISTETLDVLINAWSENIKRRFSRADHHGHINVAIGLKPATKAIRQSLLGDDNVDAKLGFFQTPTSTKQDSNFTLESIITEEDKRAQGYMTQTKSRSKPNDSWDMVAKGRVLTDAYAGETKLPTAPALNSTQKNAGSSTGSNNWAIVNISAGGYCLRWDSDDASKAQIGELIALQEFDTQNNFEWRIGVIRWMQFTREYGLEIGVQVISPKVVTATAQRLNRPNEIPFECLLLPGAKALKKASSALLPSHAFKTSDKLVIQLHKKNLHVTLGPSKEHTGSFTQFTYKNTEEDQRLRKQQKKEEATKNKDDFDELWSSL